MTVYLVWRQGYKPDGTEKIFRAAYDSVETALTQVLGDDRPGRKEVCPTCGTHVTGSPSGVGDLAMGKDVLRIEDEEGKSLWEPDKES